MATELTAVASAIHDLKELVVESLNVKKQVGQHERRLTLLEQRVNH